MLNGCDGKGAAGGAAGVQKRVRGLARACRNRRVRAPPHFLNLPNCSVRFIQWRAAFCTDRALATDAIHVGEDAEADTRRRVTIDVQKATRRGKSAVDDEEDVDAL